MKALVTALVILLAVGASADTLYTKEEGSDGSITFTPVPQDDEDAPVVDDPIDDPDEEQVVYDDPELQAIQYCQNFDTSQGLTFEYLDWQYQCDTNRDGEYKFCEDWQYPGPINFSYVWWYRGCQDDVDFSPVR